MDVAYSLVVSIIVFQMIVHIPRTLSVTWMGIPSTVYLSEWDPNVYDGCLLRRWMDYIYTTCDLVSYTPLEWQHCTDEGVLCRSIGACCSMKCQRSYESLTSAPALQCILGVCSNTYSMGFVVPCYGRRSHLYGSTPKSASAVTSCVICVCICDMMDEHLSVQWWMFSMKIRYHDYTQYIELVIACHVYVMYCERFTADSFPCLLQECACGAQNKGQMTDSSVPMDRRSQGAGYPTTPDVRHNSTPFGNRIYCSMDLCLLINWRQPLQLYAASLDRCKSVRCPCRRWLPATLGGALWWRVYELNIGSGLRVPSIPDESYIMDYFYRLFLINVIVTMVCVDELYVMNYITNMISMSYNETALCMSACFTLLGLVICDAVSWPWYSHKYVVYPTECGGVTGNSRDMAIDIESLVASHVFVMHCERVTADSFSCILQEFTCGAQDEGQITTSPAPLHQRSQGTEHLMTPDVRYNSTSSGSRIYCSMYLCFPIVWRHLLQLCAASLDRRKSEWCPCECWLPFALCSAPWWRVYELNVRPGLCVPSITDKLYIMNYSYGLMIIIIVRIMACCDILYLMNYTINLIHVRGNKTVLYRTVCYTSYVQNEIYNKKCVPLLCIAVFMLWHNTYICNFALLLGRVAYSALLHGEHCEYMVFIRLICRRVTAVVPLYLLLQSGAVGVQDEDQCYAVSVALVRHPCGVSPLLNREMGNCITVSLRRWVCYPVLESSSLKQRHLTGSCTTSRDFYDAVWLYHGCWRPVTPRGVLWCGNNELIPSLGLCAPLCTESVCIVAYIAVLCCWRTVTPRDAPWCINNELILYLGLCAPLCTESVCIVTYIATLPSWRAVTPRGVAWCVNSELIPRLGLCAPLCMESVCIVTYIAVLAYWRTVTPRGVPWCVNNELISRIGLCTPLCTESVCIVTYIAVLSCWRTVTPRGVPWCVINELISRLGLRASLCTESVCILTYLVILCTIKCGNTGQVYLYMLIVYNNVKGIISSVLLRLLTCNARFYVLINKDIRYNDPLYMYITVLRIPSSTDG